MEREEKGETKDKKNSSRGEKRASEHGEGGGRVETQDSTAGERGLSRRGAGKSSRKMKSGWWRDERRKRERGSRRGEGEKKKHRHWKKFSTDKESESRAALVSIAGRC